jgi:putative ABC transport system permease protein
MFGRKDRELDEELRMHLELATRDRVDRGEDPEAAALAARREFGNFTQVQEVTRAMWGRMWIERLAQDLRYAARLLRRAPGFSSVAILSLAVGIGVNAAIMQVINAVRLRSLPVARPYELVEITPVSLDGARGNFSSWRPALSNPVWEQIRDHQQTFAGTFAFGGATFNLAIGGEARPARGLWVSGEFFDVLGVPPAHGRLLTAADDRRGCPARAVISDDFWRREFGAATAAIGRTFTLEGQAVEIAGVTPPGFFGLEVGRGFDVAVPICSEPILTGTAGRLDSGTDWWLIVMGRLKPGVTVEQASSQLGALSGTIFKTTLAPNYPAISVPKYLAMKLHALPAGTGISQLREQYRSPLWLLLGLAVIVLIIACANLANLMLARASARQRELAVRLGLGASRGRIIRQLVTESAVLALIGAVSGLFLARIFSNALVSFVDGSGHDIVLNLELDWRVIAFTAALGALTCMIFGLVPAIRATGIGAGAIIMEAGRGLTMTRDRAMLRRLLVVAQVALSVVLIVGALLFVRTLANLTRTDPGFAREGILIASVDLGRVPLAPEHRIAYKTAVLDRVRAVPGVAAAAITTVVPVSGNAWGNDVTVQRPSGPETHLALFTRVSSGYFRTFRTPILAGRDFDERDTPTSPRVAIVNQTFVQRFFGNASPLGQRFQVEATATQPATDYDIIGVAADSKYLSLRDDIEPAAYFPMSQDPHPARWARIVIRSDADLSGITSAISRNLQNLHPNIGISFDVLSTQIARSLLRERLVATLSAFFGTVAAALALVGLYGLIAYTVSQRRKEFGVRLALGADRRAVVRLVLNEASVLVSVGVVIGLALAMTFAGLAETMLFGIRPRDPASIAAAAVALAVVALLASYVPARAAARIEPVIALRVD